MSGECFAPTNPTPPELQVKVVYWGLIRSALKQREDTVRVPAGATVRDVFAVVHGLHGDAFQDAVLTAEGTLVSNVMVLLDGTSIPPGSGLETRIDAASSVHILLTTNTMAGG